jgi:hypothetical protein
VEYYLIEGRGEEAEKIAREVGETHSATGLATMALFLEKTERPSEAEAYYQKVEERYKRGMDLTAFYDRHKDKNPVYARAAATRLAKLFPQGRAQVQLPDFSGTPDGGAMISSTSTLVQRVGLKRGDVVVGIEGQRVHTADQYTYLRDQAPDQPMTLIVWSGMNYREVQVDVPNRRLNCDLQDFAGRSVATAAAANR